MQRKFKYVLKRGLKNVFLIPMNIGITHFSNAQTFIENRFIDKNVKSKKYSTHHLPTHTNIHDKRNIKHRKKSKVIIFVTIEH